MATVKFVPIRTTAGLWDPPYCPRRFLEENPVDAGWANWAMMAHRFGREGNLALLFRRGDPSLMALEVYTLYADEREVFEHEQWAKAWPSSLGKGKGKR